MSDDPGLTPDDVKEILRLIDDSRYDEFELETPRYSVRFSRAPRAAPADTQRREGSPGASGLVDVTSPMVGTMYRAGAPGESPFVEVGARVEVGTKLCIIEVMKLMHTVAARVGGEVVEICVQNGASVQYGEVLLRIRADG
jgi:acetyl-CoA carboxylase biotin carboxyl carrier protein